MTMRVAATTWCAAVLAVLQVAPPPSLAVEVASCEEFEAVDRKTETEVTITTADFRCDSYTRLSIRSEMVLKSTVGAVTFSNLALKIYDSLTVEPDVEFTNITDVDHNGGALKVELDAVGVFEGTVAFTNISTIPADTGIRRYVKGAALHSKGNLTFKKDVTFSSCYNQQVSGDSVNEDGEWVYSASSGNGGAVHHHVKGTMHFMEKLTMIDNDAYVYFDAGDGAGGGIYNRGDVVVDGEAYFARNAGRDGGAIYQERWATFVFNSFATFQENKAWNQYGGAVANYGGDVAFKAGSLFDGNVASSTGDGGSGGALYNFDGGDMTLEGSTTFTNNKANRAAGIFNPLDLYYDTFEETNGREYRLPTIAFPDDTVFEDNRANYCVDIAYSFDTDTCGL